jgi:hypothetical protein
VLVDVGSELSDFSVSATATEVASLFDWEFVVPKDSVLLPEASAVSVVLLCALVKVEPDSMAVVFWGSSSSALGAILKASPLTSWNTRRRQSSVHNRDQGASIVLKCDDKNVFCDRLKCQVVAVSQDSFSILESTIDMS